MCGRQKKEKSRKHKKVTEDDEEIKRVLSKGSSELITCDIRNKMCDSNTRNEKEQELPLSKLNILGNSVPIKTNVYEIKNIKPNGSEINTKVDVNSSNYGSHKIQVITTNGVTINTDADIIIIANKNSSTVKLPTLVGPEIDKINLINGKLLIIKNYSLSSHVIQVENGQKLIDGSMSSIKIESGGKRNLLSVGKNWVSI
jgi:hypothetical protein